MSNGHLLLFGATGMVGANLSRVFLAEGWEVHAVHRPGSSLLRLADVAQDMSLHALEAWHKLHLTDLFDHVKPSLVINLASPPFNPPTASAADHQAVNAVFFADLLDCVRESRVRLLQAGSAAAQSTGPLMAEDLPLAPGSLYGLGKATARLSLQTFATLYELDAHELCLFTPYGAWERSSRLIPHVTLSVLNGTAVKLRSPHPTRDFVFIDDVCQAFLAAATADLQPGQIVNIGSGQETSVKEIANTICGILGQQGEIVFEETEIRPDEIWRMSANISRAKSLLNWQPETSLQQGLEKTVSWIQNNTERVKELS